MASDLETIEASGGTAWACRFEGQVLQADRRFETHVSSRGGGGAVGPHGGYLDAPQVTSHTTDHQTIFVRSVDGVERSFNLQNWNLPVRPGSRLALVWAGRAGDDNGAVLGARNLDSGEERWRDVHLWARGQGLLPGKLRVWPALLSAVLLGGAFVAFASYAIPHAPGPRSGNQNLSADLLLATGIAFVPAIVVEWMAVLIMRANDDEHRRIADLLQTYLHTGGMPP